MSELTKIASSIGASLMDAARDQIKKRWTEQAVATVESLMHEQERLHKERDAIDVKLSRNQNRMAAIEAGLFKVERGGSIIYEDESLNDSPHTLLIEALASDPNAHRTAFSANSGHVSFGECWCGNRHN